MKSTTRREFLTDVGRGMLVAGIGASVAADLGFSTAFAEDGPDNLSFGKYDALVDLLQSTPQQKLLPVLVEKLKSGDTDLKTLIGAAALANAESFGGQDYVGFHTAMAMLPAWSLTSLLPTERQALPVLKVVYRNAQQCQSLGGASHQVLKAIHDAEHAAEAGVGVQIRDACRVPDMHKAEELFGGLKGRPLAEEFNALQPAMQDDNNVHRFVFAHRTHGLAQFLGQEYAHTLLRQCVRFCVDHEQRRIQHKTPAPAIRVVLPKLLDQYKLAGKTLGARELGDEALDALAATIYLGPPERSADAVAAALADGVSAEQIGEAISLASNMLVLRQGPDKWRTHGDSAGVHSSDATNAWRNMARVVDPQHAIAGLIVAAYHSASHAPFKGDSYPLAEHRGAIKATDAAGLLAEAEDAVKHNDQGRAAAAITIYNEQGLPADGVFDALLKYTISEDGRLHGEKFYHTVREEYKTIRPAFRNRQLVALARVTASAYGYNREDQHGFRAPGYEEACRLLGVEV